MLHVILFMNEAVAISFKSLKLLVVQSSEILLKPEYVVQSIKSASQLLLSGFIFTQSFCKVYLGQSIQE